MQQGRFNVTILSVNVPGGQVSEGTDVSTTTAGYLTLPIRYTYSIYGFTMMGGIQTGLFLHGKTTDEGTAVSQDTTVYFSNEYHDINLTTFDFGITLGARQNISQRFFVSLSAYHSLINILPDNYMASRRNTNVLSAIGYRFINPKKKVSSS
jgi:hypothetical protein